MLVEEHKKTTHGARTWFGASVATVLLLVAFAAPISAASSNSTLTDPSVSPRTGTTATTIVINVTYRSDRGSRAERVTAWIGGDDKTMTRLQGGEWDEGVDFRWSGQLPVGTHPIVITARYGGHRVVSIDAGTIRISAVAAATPTPTPTPAARPKPTAAPRATARPTARPTARATARPAARATARATAKPSPTAAPTAGSLAAPSLAPTATPSPTPTATPIPTATPTALPIPAVTGGTDGSIPPASNGTTGRTGGTGQPPSGFSPLASVMAIAGLQLPAISGLTVGPTLVTTTGAVALGMAFGLFGRRRRDDDGNDAMAAAAASGVGFLPHDESIDAATTVDGIAAASGAVLDSEDTEALMPRWRRPSLIQARKADPVRDAAPAPRLTFDHGLVGPLDGPERKVVRYRVVRLLDSPDELRGSEIGYLDQGDEVQLLEKYGAYCLVRSPDGQQGWLHKMTLGDTFEEAGPAPEGPVATMPIAADSWTMGESDVDGDVFDAYLESRRRRGD